MKLSEYKCFGPDTPVHPSTVIQEQMRNDLMMVRLAKCMKNYAAKLEAALAKMEESK